QMLMSLELDCPQMPIAWPDRMAIDQMPASRAAQMLKLLLLRVGRKPKWMTLAARRPTLLVGQMLKQLVPADQMLKRSEALVDRMPMVQAVQAVRRLMLSVLLVGRRLKWFA